MLFFVKLLLKSRPYASDRLYAVPKQRSARVYPVTGQRKCASAQLVMDSTLVFVHSVPSSSSLLWSRGHGDGETALLPTTCQIQLFFATTGQTDYYVCLPITNLALVLVEIYKHKIPPYKGKASNVFWPCSHMVIFVADNNKLHFV